MTVDIKKFKKRLEVLFKNVGYEVESSLIFQDLIIFDLEYATTKDKVNVIYCGNLKNFNSYSDEIKEYRKSNTVLLFDKKVALRTKYKVWLLSELVDIEKCGYLGCARIVSR